MCLKDAEKENQVVRFTGIVGNLIPTPYFLLPYGIAHNRSSRSSPRSTWQEARARGEVLASGVPIPSLVLQSPFSFPSHTRPPSPTRAQPPTYPAHQPAMPRSNTRPTDQYVPTTKLPPDYHSIRPLWGTRNQMDNLEAIYG